MAEIVSLIGSVIGIIEGLNKANGFVRKHVHTNSSIRKELVPMLAKVTAFAGLLQALKLEAEFEEHDKDRLKVLAHVDGPLYACKDAVKAIENRLDRIISIGSLNFGRVLDKECLSALNILDQTKPILELALVADQMTLLTSVDSYVQLIAEQLHELRTDSNKSLQRLQERSASIEAHLVQIRSSKEDSANLKRQEQILVWTSSLNYRANFTAARKHTAGVPGTGRWFIDGPDFRQWTGQSPDVNAILLQGIPGAGKTVLSSTVIDEIMQTTSATEGVQIAYFFFDFNDPAKQTVDNMLRSLVFQLAVSVETIPKSLEEIYTRHHQDRGSTTQPTIEEWTSILLQLLRERELCYIVTDALDECLEEDLLIDAIKDLVFRSSKSTRWLFTCQISDGVSSTLKSVNIKSVRIESSAVDLDIATYLHATLENDPKLRSFTSKAKAMISSETRSKARGMFRWAQCQVEALRQLKDRRLKTVELALSRMPEDLNASYERMLLQLCSFDPGTAVSNERLVFRILVFVAFSGRPVTVAEAAEFAIIEDSAEKIQPDDRFEDPMSILSFVGSLISVQDSILTLAHKSVKDFLETPRALNGILQLGLFLGMSSETDETGIAADVYIAQKCLGYLALPHVSARQTMFTGDVKDPNTTFLGILQREYPLLDYAASMWPYHLRESISQQRNRDEMQNALHLNFPKSQPTLWQGWLFLQRADIWERQVKLAGFLCECFIRSSLVDGWANNFWQYRQNYRVINNSSSEPRPAVRDEVGLVYNMDSKTALGLRSIQFHDLALLLLEIAFQKSIYTQRQAEIQKISTLDDMKSYVKRLEEESKEVVPRMGEGYHWAVSECLQFVMHRDVEGPDARPLFQMQSHVMDTILQPLRSSASSGFRHSRGIWTYNTADIKSLLAKIEEHGRSQRFSVPAAGVNIWDSAVMPQSNSFSRTHGPDGSLKKPLNNSEHGQNAAICLQCRSSFSSQNDLTSHNAANKDYCWICKVCLPRKLRGEHDRIYHRRENGDARWTMTSYQL